MLKLILLEPEVDTEYKLSVPSYQGKPSLWALYLGTFLREKISKVEITILDCRFFSTDKLRKWAKKSNQTLLALAPNI